MLACGTPDAVDRYQQAKQAAAHGTVLEGKNSGLGGVSVRPWRRTPIGRPRRDSEVDSSITQAKVTEVVLSKLLSGKAPGVDEIRPEYLKSLDVVGLSWLTRLCNIAWRLGTVPLEWQTGVVVPLFKKGDRRVCSNYRGITLLSLPGKVYARVLERRIRPIVDPRIQEEQCGFRVLVVEHWTSSIPFVQDDVVLLASSSQGQAVMRISTSKSEAMVLDRKRVACPLRVGGEVLPQVEEFKYLGVLFTSEGKMEREIDRRIGAASTVMRSVYRTVVVKKELSRKAKLSIYLVNLRFPTLTYGHELWSRCSFSIERSQLRWLGHLFQMPPGRLPREVFQACPTGRRPRGRPRTRWRDYVSRTGLGTPRGPPGRAGGSVWGEGSLGISAQSAASRDPVPDQADENGWMD
ncbi:hypothetical protein L3Q82_013828, partial [Scortum barcoo]